MWRHFPFFLFYFCILSCAHFQLYIILDSYLMKAGVANSKTDIWPSVRSHCVVWSAQLVLFIGVIWPLLVRLFTSKVRQLIRLSCVFTVKDWNSSDSHVVKQVLRKRGVTQPNRYNYIDFVKLCGVISSAGVVYCSHELRLSSTHLCNRLTPME